MKKNRKYIILILIAGLLTISACASKDISDSKVDEIEGEMLDIIEGEEAEDIKSEFQELMLREDKKTEDIIDFLDENIGKVSKKEAEEMMLEFEKCIIENMDSALEELKSLDKKEEILNLLNDNAVLTEDDLNRLESGEIKSIIEKLLESGYKVSKDGEELRLSVNYDKFSKYEEYISDNFKGYLSIKSREANQPVWFNGELNVAYDELANRLVEIEKYLISNEEPYGYESMLRSYRNNLLIYLRGNRTRYRPEMENEPIDKDMYSSWEKVAKNKEGILSHIMREYMEAVKANNRKLNKEVYDKILPLVNEAIGTIEENNRKLSM